MAIERGGIECPVCGSGTYAIDKHFQHERAVRRRLCRKTPGCNHVFYTIETRIGGGLLKCDSCETSLGIRVKTTFNYQKYLVRQNECRNCQTAFRSTERILSGEELHQVLKTVNFNQEKLFD